MFLLDKPFVSEFLINTIQDNAIPVVDFTKNNSVNSLTTEQAVEWIIKQFGAGIYTNSENAIDWINQNLASTSLPKKINLFKDKYKFRQLIHPLYPDFFFESVSIDQLGSIDFSTLPLPFIIKPCVGFFSMGVYKVRSLDEWDKTRVLIREEMQQVKGLYPHSVMGDEHFIIEQNITGDEFAVDAYINNQGQAVILNILQHTFASDEDVSDRVYTTSKEIIEHHLEDFTEFTQKLADLAKLRNFPMHIELRQQSNGELLPIEVNPMRFGGWCTTADMSFYAYGFNQYLYYLKQLKPDWRTILTGKDDKLYSIIVLDNASGKHADEIKNFDFKKVLKDFARVMEYRVIDFRSYPLFGFLFVETNKTNTQELDNILQSDLNQYLNLMNV
jgi:hypothetical protein